jgi:hypothetical protein
MEQSAQHSLEQEAANSVQSPAKRSTVQSSSLVGLNDDGTVTGAELEYVNANESVLPDDKCCSDTCFWRKSNRTDSRGMEKVSWSKQECQMFDLLYPAYYTDRRGACMLAHSKVINKSCAAVRVSSLIRSNTHFFRYSSVCFLRAQHRTPPVRQADTQAEKHEA